MDKNLHNKVLDSLNRAILKELCENARVSNTEIGRRVGLSAPAVADRIGKMEEHGIILGSSVLLDFDKLGLTIRAFVSFTAAGMKHDAMVKLFDSIPGVNEWYAVTGNTTMLLKIIVATSQQLEAVIGKLMDHGETSTSLILSGHKKMDMLAQIPAR